MYFPQDQVFWYLKRDKIEPLRKDLVVDVVIVGGGMAGLTAAQKFLQRGLKVALLEQYYCGAGASGKSSGFITPDAEIPLSGFAAKYGSAIAKNIWDRIIAGGELIRSNIEKYGIDCDYQIQDTMVLANSKKTIQEIKDEHNVRLAMGYASTFYSQDELSKVLNAQGYFAGVKYGGSFGIESYRYCQAMKDILLKEGVLLFEESPVTELTDSGVKTAHAQVTAKHTIVCADRFIPRLNKLTHEVYHAETFLLMSQVLTDAEIKEIFPQEKLMAWDTDMIYTYFRITGDNRLLLGGGSLLTNYAKEEIHHSQPLYNKLTNYFKTKFPQSQIQFEYFWPGLIGLSKDIVPLAGFDKDQKNIYYISAAAGLPIAAALAEYCVERVLDNKNELDAVFNPYRRYVINNFIQNIIGNKATFAISNFIANYYPKNKG